MKRNTMSYKVQQFLMFAGAACVLFLAVVIVPFIYGIYLTLTSWDGIAKTKPFV
jgi:raffinose/stachyose/melibiose transport system permease protein